jgi:hypothetical protein
LGWKEPIGLVEDFPRPLQSWFGGFQFSLRTKEGARKKGKWLLNEGFWLGTEEGSKWRLGWSWGGSEASG